jgi:hypothetical protein
MTASAFGCPNPSYQFWILSPGASTWRIAQPYSTNPVFNWNPSAKTGTYRITVWARDANSPGRLRNALGTWDSSTNSQHTAATATACTAIDNVAAPPSPLHAGSVITFTASATGCPNPSYELWVLAPGARTWRIVKPYGTNAVFSWNTAGNPAGTYRIAAWARDAASPGTFVNALGRRDISIDSQLTLVPATACMSVSDAAAPPSTSTPGTAVTFTAAASDCPNARYQFWMLAPGARAWQVVQAYSPNAVFIWDTTGKAAGIYRITVWARDSQSPGTTGGTTGTWDTSNDSEYTIG